MPHDVCHHSGIVQARAHGSSPNERHEAIRFVTTFNHSGDCGVEALEGAQRLLTLLSRPGFALILISIALLASGLSSRVIATTEAKIAIEGFINLKTTLRVRCIITHRFTKQQQRFNS
ncbi:divalent metal cation transporter [Pseudovibrio sp. Ad26]|uniref:divalent metal cation transporter n=1 Tax=Pseudovibrio sp. Ad26 TaxID=989410 RepID=UPI0007B214E5|nr:divalent metal cation transporter [Pseudovibrio sp. Ad26]KZL16197.1 Divalent metal cation transporter MntH [Pseudovibrio sp. Ad26]